MDKDDARVAVIIGSFCVVTAMCITVVYWTFSTALAHEAQGRVYKPAPRNSGVDEFVRTCQGRKDYHKYQMPNLLIPICGLISLPALHLAGCPFRINMFYASIWAPWWSWTAFFLVLNRRPSRDYERLWKKFELSDGQAVLGEMWTELEALDEKYGWCTEARKRERPSKTPLT